MSLCALNHIISLTEDSGVKSVGNEKLKGYWRASEASETLSGVTQSRFRYIYLFIYLFICLWGT